MRKDAARNREYQRERYRIKKTEAVAELGGRCVKCSSTEDLQFDHIDPTSKVKNVTVMFNTVKWKDEIKKCQLLCRKCHIDKSIIDKGHKKAVGTHGTLSSYKYCKCDLCRDAKSEYSREYYKRVK